MALGTRYSFNVIATATLAAAMGGVAAILGLVAERKRISADEIVWDDVTSQCIMPVNKTFTLSIAAAFLLLSAQVILTAAGGCLCCNYKIDKLTSPAPLAIKSLIISWALCVVAVIFYLYGAGVSSNHHARPGNPRALLPATTSASCGYAIDSGVLASAALMSLLATISGVTYYLAASRIFLIHTWLGQPTFYVVKPQAPLGPTPLTIISTKVEIPITTTHPTSDL